MRFEDIEKILFPWQLEEFKKITKLNASVEKKYRDQNETIQKEFTSAATSAAMLAASAMASMNVKNRGSQKTVTVTKLINGGEVIYCLLPGDRLTVDCDHHINNALSALREGIDKAFDIKQPCDDAKRIELAKVCYKQACDYESTDLSNFVHRMSNLLGTEETNYKLFFKSCFEIVKGEFEDSKELAKNLEKKTEEVEGLQITLKLCDQKNINAANEMYARISRDGLLNFIKGSL